MVESDSACLDALAAARRVATVEQRVRGLLSSLRGEVACCSGGWDDDVSSEVDRLMTSYDAEVHRLGDAMAAMAEQVAAAQNVPVGGVAVGASAGGM